MENYKTFTNKKCEFFPCHRGVPEGDFNCLFCYCPLYPFEDCGGQYVYSGSIKDCGGCVYPHIKQNYDEIIFRLKGRAK